MQDPSLNGLFIITEIACVLVIKHYFARFWYLSIWYTSDQKHPSDHWILLASELCQEALCRSWPESVSWPFISNQLQITHLCSGGLRGGEFVVLMSSMLLTSNMTSVCLGLHCHLYHLLFFFLFFFLLSSSVHWMHMKLLASDLVLSPPVSPDTILICSLIFRSVCWMTLYFNDNMYSCHVSTTLPTHLEIAGFRA